MSTPGCVAPQGAPCTHSRTAAARHKGQDATRPAGLARAEPCREGPNLAQSLTKLGFPLAHVEPPLFRTPRRGNSSHQQRVRPLGAAVISPTGLNSLKHSCLSPRKNFSCLDFFLSPPLPLLVCQPLHIYTVIKPPGSSSLTAPNAPLMGRRGHAEPKGGDNAKLKIPPAANERRRCLLPPSPCTNNQIEPSRWLELLRRADPPVKDHGSPRLCRALSTSVHGYLQKRERRLM